MVRLGLVALLALTGAGAPAVSAQTPQTAQAAPAAQASFSTVGVVSAGNWGDGTVWFEVGGDQRFTATEADVAELDALTAALKASNDTNRSVVVRYDPDSGRIASDGTPTFVLREATYDGRTFTVKPGAAARGSRGGARAEAEAALAKGVALYGAGDAVGARAALDRALDSHALPTRLKALALKTRGDAASGMASDLDQEGAPESDALLVAALADYEAWRALAPDDAKAVYAVAGALRDLGAYDEALEVYRALAAKWPDEGYWIAIRTGSTYRTLGDFDRALKTLDQYAAKRGAIDGMAFRYHRGWTLNRLGRNKEAVTEFTKGLENQPDYPSALLMRACARAELGALAEALADQERGLELMRAWRTEPATKTWLKYEGQAEEAAAKLREAVTRGGGAGVGDLCAVYRSAGDVKRERSPLLPKQG